jgi:hypothetical protein
MAHWGVAMSQFHELWGRPDPAALNTGLEETTVATTLANKTNRLTPRELAYIHALNIFYTEAPAGYQKAADDYTAAMAALHAAYPDDIEGAAFYALAILASTPPNDTSLTHERKALAILIPLFQQHPDHPGLAHYIIHTCDTPALAADGLDAARVYARIAPSSAHATHMPGSGRMTSPRTKLRSRPATSPRPSISLASLTSCTPMSSSSMPICRSARTRNPAPSPRTSAPSAPTSMPCPAWTT